MSIISVLTCRWRYFAYVLGAISQRNNQNMWEDVAENYQTDLFCKYKNTQNRQKRKYD